MRDKFSRPHFIEADGLFRACHRTKPTPHTLFRIHNGRISISFERDRIKIAPFQAHLTGRT